MKMSVSNYDLLQAKVDAELARYTEELMSHGPQEVVDNAYELVIKSELAVRLESTFLSKQQIRALLDQENRWPTSMNDGRTTMPPLAICCAIPSTRRVTMPTEND